MIFIGRPTNQSGLAYTRVCAILFAVEDSLTELKTVGTIERIYVNDQAQPHLSGNGPAKHIKFQASSKLYSIEYYYYFIRPVTANSKRGRL